MAKDKGKKVTDLNKEKARRERNKRLVKEEFDKPPRKDPKDEGSR